MRIGARGTGQRVAFAALLLVALLMRMAVPPGYMLAPGTGGWPVVPCDGFGAAPPPAPVPDAGHDAHALHGSHHMAHGAHHAPPHEHAPGPVHKTDHPCAFGGLTLAAAPPMMPVVALFAPILAVAPAFHLAEVMVGRGLAAPPPPATGPPARL